VRNWSRIVSALFALTGVFHIVGAASSWASDRAVATRHLLFLGINVAFYGDATRGRV
jgi:hypothetical protein